jgi:hypothetical protein
MDKSKPSDAESRKPEKYVGVITVLPPTLTVKFALLDVAAPVEVEVVEEVEEVKLDPDGSSNFIGHQVDPVVFR